MKQNRGEDQSPHYQSVNMEYNVTPKDEHSYVEQNNNNYYSNGTIIKQNISNKQAYTRQVFVAIAVLIVTTGCGMPIGYSAILLPQLSQINGTIHIDKETGSWIASVHSLAMPIAALISGLLLDAIGRRGCLQLSTIPLCVGWIIMGFSTNISYILAGRIILGAAVGLMAVPSQVLTGETANAKLRGMLAGTGLTAYSVGILITYIAGAYLNWRIVAFMGTVLPVIALISLCFIPESPTWLVRKNNIEAAKKALLWLRGNDVEQVNQEIASLESRAKADAARQCEATSLLQKISSAVSVVSSPGVLKPLFIISIFNLLQQLSGTYVVVFYGVEIIRDIGAQNINTYLAAIVTAVIRFISTSISCFLLLHVGRRTLIIVSAAGTCLASFTLVGYLQLKKEESQIDVYIIITCLLIYVGFNTIGLFCLPMIMMSELFPPRARGFICGCTCSLFNFILFGVTKLFPKMEEVMGISGVFALFGTSAFLIVIFIYLVLPETKDRTLEEIEDYFQKGSIFWILRKESKKNFRQHSNIVSIRKSIT